MPWRCSVLVWIVALLCLAWTAMGIAETVTQTYSYDANGRLVASAIASEAVAYEYDAVGNLVQRDAPEPGATATLLVATGLLAALGRRRGRRRVVPLATLLLIASAPLGVRAHIFDTTRVVIRGAGGTGKFSILDPTGCLATITVTSADPNVATASPPGPILSAFQTYDVTAATDLEFDLLGFRATTLFVHWVGFGFRPGTMIPCDEDATQPIIVEVRQEPQGSGNQKQAGFVADPIGTATGELYDALPPDLDLGGGPLGIAFERYYGSELVADGFARTGTGALDTLGSLGPGWRHRFEWSLERAGDVAEVLSPDGRVIRFEDSIPGLAAGVWTLVGRSDVPFQLVNTAGTTTLVDPRTTLRYAFGSLGELVNIRDRRGNQLTLSYSGGRLVQVSDGLGRVLAFTNRPADGRLLTVVAGARQISFTYDVQGRLSTWTDARGEVTTYAYDGTSERLASVTRPRGNDPISQTWDAEGRVATQTDGEAATLALDYTPGPSGAQTTVTDPLGSTMVHEHDATAALSVLEDPVGATATFGNDSKGRRASILDRRGATTAYNYHEPSGRLASIQHAGGGTTTFTWQEVVEANGIRDWNLARIDHPDTTHETFGHDAQGNVTTHTDRRGLVWTRTYDVRGRLLSSVAPDGGTTSFTYGSDGSLATLTDPVGNTTTLSYDAARRISAIALPGGGSYAYVWDAADGLVSVTNPRGHTATVTRDDNGNGSGFVDFSGASFGFTYDGMDRPTAITDPTGQASMRGWDARGHGASWTDRSGRTHELVFDAQGRHVGYADPAGHDWTAGFDAEGVLASLADPLGNTTLYQSDAHGRPTRRTSPRGGVAELVWDLMGRLVTRTDPLGRITRYLRDAAGFVTDLEMPDGTHWLYQRNARGQITRVTDARGNPWDQAYDVATRTTSRTDPLGNAIGYQYDPRGRPVVATLAGLGTQTLTYDAVGNVTRRLYSDGTDLVYTYDAMDRLLTGPGLDLDYDAAGRVTGSNGIANAHDADGRLLSVTLAPGKVVTYTYDARGRLASIGDWIGGATTFAYDAAGRLTSIARPNQVTTTYAYDADGRVTLVRDGQPGNVEVGRVDLQRNLAGEVMSATRNLPLVPDLGALADASFAHDAADRVAAHTWDALGRRTADGLHTYEWDLAERLRGLDALDYTYDGWNQRLDRVEGGITRSLVWNYGLRMPSPQIEREGAVDRRYWIYTPNGRLVAAIEADGTRRYFHFDEGGNTVYLTDATGNVVQSYSYGPYGEPLGAAGAVENPFQWQGAFGVMAEPGGLYAMRARWYDARTASFLSRDPVPSVLPRSAPGYQYALGNPLSFADPLGTATVATPDPASDPVFPPTSGPGNARESLAGNGYFSPVGGDSGNRIIVCFYQSNPNARDSEYQWQPPDPGSGDHPRDKHLTQRFFSQFTVAAQDHAYKENTITSGTAGNIMNTFTGGGLGEGCSAWRDWMQVWLDGNVDWKQHGILGVEAVHIPWHNLVRVKFIDGSTYVLDPWRDLDNPVWTEQEYAQEIGQVQTGTWSAGSVPGYVGGGLYEAGDAVRWIFFGD
jgi:RHS repeat-associated protein